MFSAVFRRTLTLPSALQLILPSFGLAATLGGGLQSTCSLTANEPVLFIVREFIPRSDVGRSEGWFVVATRSINNVGFNKEIHLALLVNVSY